jgi:sporulation protein YlmC with PRC-barrel domain
MVISSDNPLSGEELWLDVSDIKKVGEDIIFTEHAALARKAPATGQKVQEFVGLPVSSQDGRQLGSLADIEINIDTWAVSALGLGAGQAVRVEGDKTVLGEDVILVAAGAPVQASSETSERKKLFTALFKEDYLQQASKTLKRFLRGSEANLPKPPAAKPAQNGHEPKSST